MIKKLLSLPANLVGSFYNIEHADPNEWFCTSDPSGTKVGSGGGTAWLLEQSYRHDTDGSAIAPESREVPNRQMIPWLAANKRIILHAGGQSRRLPAYAPSGKILTPIPVFRWARGQRIDQNLLETKLDRLVTEKITRILNAMPDAEADEIAGAARYERTNDRKAFPAGHYERRPAAKAGQLELGIPELKGAVFESVVIERYRRREQSAEESLIDM